MRIAIIVDDFHGGAGNVAQLLALALSGEHKVSIVITNPRSELRYDLPDVSVYRVNTSISGKNKIVGLFSSIGKLRKTLNAEIEAELVISFINNINSLTCLSQWFTKTPIIVSERSNPVVILPKKPWNIIRRIAYRRADVVTVQFDDFRGFDGGRFEKKCRTTPNIIDRPKAIKTEYESDKVRFATFGRIVAIKRMDLMIRMFARALKENPDIELHIFGDGSDKEKLAALIEDLGVGDSVFLRGYCNDTHGTLPTLDAYLMTSYQEGFPNSLCEAMAVGLPSVTFCCHEGIRELCMDGQTGMVIDEGDEDGFVSAILRLAGDTALRREMGERARSIVDRYSHELVMGTWRACIDEAIGNRKRK